MPCASPGFRACAAHHILSTTCVHGIFQVKLLVDHIAQGTSCGKSVSKVFAKDSSSQRMAPRYQIGDSPASVLQLNESTTNRTESFDLENTGEVSLAMMSDDSASNPFPTHRLFIDFILTLTKHMMHWAASNRVAVDPTLWESHVLGYGSGGRYADGGNGHQAGVREDQDKSRAMSTPGWFTIRAKGLCDHAASILLDGVDRTPSSWRCLINYAQLVLKNSIEILEKTNAGPTMSGGGSAGGNTCKWELAEEMEKVGHLEETLVGVLLPSVVNGLLPFAHVPVFARRLLKMLTYVVRLLDEACCRYSMVRKADANYLAARNGGASRRKPQVMSRRAD